MPPGQPRFVIHATLWLRRAEDDGPTQPRASGWRPNCWFGHMQDGERLYNDCVIEFVPGKEAYERDGKLWVDPGAECSAELVPLWPQLVRDAAQPASLFEVCEGHRVIADALVERVTDPGLDTDPEWHGVGPRFKTKEEAVAWAHEEAARIVAGEFDADPVGRFNAAQRLESVLCNFQWGDARDAPPGLADFVFGWNVSGPEADAEILAAAKKLAGGRQ